MNTRQASRLGLTLAVASVALWASGCQEHLETSLTPAQKKQFNAMVKAYEKRRAKRRKRRR